MFRLRKRRKFWVGGLRRLRLGQAAGRGSRCPSTPGSRSWNGVLLPQIRRLTVTQDGGRTGDVTVGPETYPCDTGKGLVHEVLTHRLLSQTVNVFRFTLCRTEIDTVVGVVWSVRRQDYRPARPVTGTTGYEELWFVWDSRSRRQRPVRGEDHPTDTEPPSCRQSDSHSPSRGSETMS